MIHSTHLKSRVMKQKYEVTPGENQELRHKIFRLMNIGSANSSVYCFKSLVQLKLNKRLQIYVIQLFSNLLNNLKCVFYGVQ